MERVVHDIHSGWEIVWERYRHPKLAEPLQVSATIRLQIPFRIGNNDSQDATTNQNPITVSDEGRELFSRLQMLHEMLHADPFDAPVAKG